MSYYCFTYITWVASDTEHQEVLTITKYSNNRHITATYARLKLAKAQLFSNVLSQTKL